MSPVALTLAAQEDLTGIWLYTFKSWGVDQAEKYYDQIVSCCQAIGAGQARSKPVEGLVENVHVHRCQHHYIFFLDTERPVILAVLNQRMDFIARLQNRLDQV